MEDGMLGKAEKAFGEIRFQECFHWGEEELLRRAEKILMRATEGMSSGNKKLFLSVLKEKAERMPEEYHKETKKIINEF